MQTNNNEDPLVTPERITIAVTVFNRRDYIFQAIESALSQTASVKVIVIEDHGPDEGLRNAVLERFRDRITYHRNPVRLGLCGNWNSCLTICPTPWLSILHDDDFLEPTFIASMVQLAHSAPGRALYYGLCHVVDEEGRYLEKRDRCEIFAWHDLGLNEWARYNPVCFPGQLFSVATALNVGGFRSSSRYTADWEMWLKLALRKGAAGTNRVVANYREYYSQGRGTTDMDISGRKYAISSVQQKRNYALLARTYPKLRFDRRQLLKHTPMSSRFLLLHAHGFSSRMLRYNAGLLRVSSAPNFRYWLFQFTTKLLSWRWLRFASSMCRFLVKKRSDVSTSQNLRADRDFRSNL